MSTENFEGIFWHAKVVESNRFPTRIEFTSQGSDGYFLVPQTRVESVLERLESGESPDNVAQTLPIDERPK